jgi:hypothetical protein
MPIVQPGATFTRKRTALSWRFAIVNVTIPQQRQRIHFFAPCSNHLAMFVATISP